MAGDPSDLIALLRDLDEDAVVERVQRRLDGGEDPLRIMAECQEGVRQVGLLYEERRYFVSALIMAGEILRRVLDLVEPVLEHRPAGAPLGTILLGTVQGDIHDIGKNVMHMLLRCNGFQVVDLGVDVPPKVFLETALEIRPAVVCLSGLLTSAFDAMRDTVALLRSGWEGGDAPPAILIGGGMMDEKVWHHVGADYWAPDAPRGVEICQRLADKGGAARGG